MVVPGIRRSMSACWTARAAAATRVAIGLVRSGACGRTWSSRGSGTCSSRSTIGGAGSGVGRMMIEGATTMIAATVDGSCRHHHGQRGRGSRRRRSLPGGGGQCSGMRGAHSTVCRARRPPRQMAGHGPRTMMGVVPGEAVPLLVETQCPPVDGAPWTAGSRRRRSRRSRSRIMSERVGGPLMPSSRRRRVRRRVHSRRLHCSTSGTYSKCSRGHQHRPGGRGRRLMTSSCWNECRVGGPYGISMSSGWKNIGKNTGLCKRC